jgi:protein-disulfide isomerase-like protein with CxxC motif
MNPDKFFDKMKKKPAVQAVLDNISAYSEEDIMQLSGSHFPQWIRDALLRKKQGMAQGDIEARAFEIAQRMNAASGMTMDLPVYEMESIPETAGKKFTTADFALTLPKTGTVLDSLTQGKHEDSPEFEEHMRKVRERMRK